MSLFFGVIFGLALSLSAAFPACARQASEPQEALGASCFPAAAGYRWTYSAKRKSYNLLIRRDPTQEKTVESEVVVDMDEGKDQEAGTFTLTFSPAEKGKLPGDRKILKTADGIYESSIAESNLVLKISSKPGDQWGVGGGKEGTPAYRNAGQEEVEVPAGKFRCWKITMIRLHGLGSRRWTRWYAPEAGLVKEVAMTEIEGGAVERTLELKAFSKKDGAEKK